MRCSMCAIDRDDLRRDRTLKRNECFFMLFLFAFQENGARRDDDRCERAVWLDPAAQLQQVRVFGAQTTMMLPVMMMAMGN